MSQKTVRDFRIDFVRGLALIMIFINHIGNTVYAHLTNKNYGFSDSAEVFVLLAGYASAMAYYHRFDGGQPVETSIRVARRAGHLYVVHILTTVLAIAMFSLAATWFLEPKFLREINIGPIIAKPAEAIVGLVTLTHQLDYFNILPLYIVLLLLTPLVMVAYKWNWQALIGVSLLVYLIAGFNLINLPSYPAINSWFFNPLCWQLLFVLGFVWGARVRGRLGIPWNRTLFLVCAVYLVIGLVWIQTPSLWPSLPKTGPLGALGSLSKTYISPFRLLHVLALAYVVGMSPLALWMKRIPESNAIVQMGQHALPVFCTGSLLSMFFAIVRQQHGSGLLIDTLCVATGIAVMVGLALFLAWQSHSPAGQVGSVSASGFVAATPPVPPPSVLVLPPPVR